MDGIFGNQKDLINKLLEIPRQNYTPIYHQNYISPY